MSDVPTPPSDTSLEVSKDDRTMAMLAHVLPVVTGFIGPLLILLIKGEESAFVKYHAMQSLIFTGIWTISFMVLYVITCGFGVLIILPLFPLIIVAQIYIGIQANNGLWMGYPGLDKMGRT